MCETQHVLQIIYAAVVTSQNSLLHLLNSLQKKSYMMFNCILTLSQYWLTKAHETMFHLQHPGAEHAQSNCA